MSIDSAFIYKWVIARVCGVYHGAGMGLVGWVVCGVLFFVGLRGNLKRMGVIGSYSCVYAHFTHYA